MLSSGGLAVSLSGSGLVGGVPLRGAFGLFGLVSTIFTVGGKRFDKRFQNMREKTVSRAKARHISISSLVSKAVNDGSISELEFNLIMREVEQYRSLKDKIRSTTSKGQKVDVEALKEEIKKEYQKNSNHSWT